MAFGGRKRVRIEIVSHGWGAIHGASRPSNTMVPTVINPALSGSGIGRRGGACGTAGTSDAWSSDIAAETDFGVEAGVEQVRREAGKGVDRGDDQYGCLQRRQVAVLDREDNEAA